MQNGMGTDATKALRVPNVLFLLLCSLFLASSDLLTHGPSMSSIFQEIYYSAADVDVTVLGFLGCLLGCLVLVLCPKTFEKHRIGVIYFAIVIAILSVALRYFALRISMTLCIIAVFLAGLLLPFSKLLFFYGLSLHRNTLCFVLPASPGMVGKVFLLTLISNVTTGTQIALFVSASLLCLLSFWGLSSVEKKTDFEDTSALVAQPHLTWPIIVGTLAVMTLVSAFFRVFQTGNTFPIDPVGILLEIILYVLICFVPCYLLASEKTTPDAKFRSCMIVLLLGLLIFMGQSASTWSFSNQVNRQIVHFFRSFALVMCWVSIIAASWANRESSARIFAIVLAVFCFASIGWYLALDHLGGLVSVLIGILIYGIILVTNRLLPDMHVSDQKDWQRGVEERLEEMAAEFGLSERERDIFVPLAQGRSRQAIASSLYLSEGTVKSYTSRIYRKLGVSGKDELLAKVQSYSGPSQS